MISPFSIKINKLVFMPVSDDVGFFFVSLYIFTSILNNDKLY